MRALVNELERVKALARHDEETHLYQGDASAGLSALIEVYRERSEGDTSLTPWRELLDSLAAERWPGDGA